MLNPIKKNLRFVFTLTLIMMLIMVPSVFADSESPITTWAELQAALDEGGTVTLTQDVIAGESDNKLNINSTNVTLDLNGHIIDFSAATAKESVIMLWKSNAIFTIKDSNPTATHEPAFTYINPVTNEEVVVNGGIITGGHTNGLYVGGGLSCYSGTCIFEGGSIAGNISTSDGGAGVCIFYGIFNMTGGSICGNVAAGVDAYGGGVKVHSVGTFNMSGGSVTGNSTPSVGGGIWGGGNFTISGGSVTYNKSAENGGGIADSCKMSGNPVIMNNMKGDIVDNVHCNITIVGELTDGASIGVSTATPALGAPKAFTSDYSTYNSDDNPSDFFVSDIEGTIVDLNANGEAQLSIPVEIVVIQGQVVYELHDSYGDGWSGCAIKIIDTSGDALVETLTMAAGSKLNGVTESLLPGHVYNFCWIKGSYEGETSFSLKNESGDLLFEGGGISGNCVFLNVQVDCNVTVTNDGNGTASANPTSGPQGIEVTLTATPNSGYRFKEWQVISGDVIINNNKFTFGTSNVEIKAIFEEDVTRVSTWQELQSALNVGGSIKLTQDIVASSTDTQLYTDKNVVLDLNGYIINRNLQVATSDGGVIYVGEPGNLIINDSRPDATHSPEITYRDLLTNEDVVVNGGIITGGYNNNDSGGIYFRWSYGTINGGTIVGNKSLGVDTSGNAGGLVIVSSTVTMNGGAIVGNEALYGDGDGIAGGVYIQDLQGSVTIFNMNGGKITSTYTNSTDGSCLAGVYVYASELNISGNSYIYGNMKNGEDNNIVLSNTTKGRCVHLTGELTEGAHFGVTTWRVPPYFYSPEEFTTGYLAYNSEDDASTFFTLDEDRALLLYDGTTEPRVAWKYTLTLLDDGNGTASGDMTEFCYCLYPTLTATPNDGYEFKEWQVISGNVNISNDNKVHIGTEPDGDNPVTDVRIKAIFEGVPVLGDLNNDNSISILDVRLLLQAYINSSASTEWTERQLTIMDINKDSKVDIIDVRLLLQIYINQ